MVGVKKGIWLATLCLAALAAQATLATEEPPPPSNKPAAEQPSKPKSAPLDENKEAAKSPDDAAAPAEQADPFAVPDGTPKELVQYIKKLVSTPPRDEETRAKMRDAILKAAEKILAGNPNEDERDFGVRAKMNMIQDQKQLAAFTEELMRGGHEKLAHMVRGFALQLELRKSLVAGGDQMKTSVENVRKYFDESKVDSGDIGLAFMAGRIAEMTNDNELAVRTYNTLAKAFAASEDARVAEFAKTLAGVVRRLTLVGNEIKIEGKLLDGKDFDWSKYAGKVVLIDFWATWCGPCIAEIPSLKKSYELYHDKGFDIVGVSCDRRFADLEKFVKEKNIPWAIVFGNDKPSPTVSYYGIMGIPTQILVGKDGKVITLNARGETLKEELTKLLGPVEEKADEKKDKAKDAQKPETKESNNSDIASDKAAKQ